MGKWLGLIALAVVALVGWRGFLFFEAAGAFRQVAETPTGECRASPAIDGVLDIVLDPSSFNIYVSSFARGASHKSVRGAVSVFSARIDDVYFSYGPDEMTFQPVPPPRLVQDAADLTDTKSLPAFAPDGLSFHRDPDKTRQMAVINHADGETVEIFDVERGAYAGCKPDEPRLVHHRTVRSPLFSSLNSIALIGPDQFYVTNDHHFRRGFLQRVEDFLMLPSANVVYFDGTSARVAASGLTFASGAAASWDGKRVFVAETTPHLLLTYDRDPESGSLTLAPAPIGRFDTGTSVTKIVVPYGAFRRPWLVLAAHPKLLSFLGVFGSNRTSPSEVLWVGLGAKSWTANTIFRDDGKRVPQLDALAEAAGTLVLGSTAEGALSVCRYSEFPPPPPPPELQPPHDAPASCMPPEVRVDTPPEVKRKAH